MSMSVDMVKEIHAVEIEIGDELDFDGDEYCDNELALFGYATVAERREWYDMDNDLWITILTDQGEFDIPGNHHIKLKVVD